LPYIITLLDSSVTIKEFSHEYEEFKISSISIQPG